MILDVGGEVDFPDLTLDDCCATLQDQNTPLTNKFALLAVLPQLFQDGGSLTPSQATALVNALPVEFIKEVLTEHAGPECARYQKLTVDILSTLLPSADQDARFQYRSLLPLLLGKLGDTEYGASATGEELDSLTQCVLSLLGGSMDSENAHSLLDPIGKQLCAQTAALPSLTLINRCVLLLDLLHDLSDDYSSVVSSHSWPSDLRTVVQRVLQTKAINARHRDGAFRLACRCVYVLDTDWLAAWDAALPLLATLNTVQIRVLLNRPDEVDADKLAEYARLCESLIRCVEEAEWLDDARATLISKTLHEAVAFAAEYWNKCEQGKAGSADADPLPELSPSVRVILYRLLCVFLSIGGAATLEKKLLTAVAPLLINEARRMCKEGLFESAHLLIVACDQLPVLCPEMACLLAEYVKTQEEGEWQEASETVLDAVFALKERSDWYSAVTLSTARRMLAKIPHPELQQEMASI